MNRTEMIQMLCDKLRVMNAHRVENGQTTQEELDRFVSDEQDRYEAMGDNQLRNLCLINFF